MLPAALGRHGARSGAVREPPLDTSCSLWAHMGCGQTARGSGGNAKTLFWRGPGGDGIAKIIFRRIPGGVGITTEMFWRPPGGVGWTKLVFLRLLDGAPDRWKPEVFQNLA